MRPRSSRPGGIVPRLLRAGGTVSSVVLIAVVGTGCVFRSGLRPIVYYDLRVPDDLVVAAAPTEKTLEVGRFVSKLPSRTRMLFRLEGQRLVPDEYNRWIEAPERLVEREFLRCFSCSGLFARVVDSSADAADYSVYGALLALEQRDGKEVELSVMVRVESTAGGDILMSRVYREREALASAGADSFAEGSTRALGRLMQRVAGDMMERVQN